MGIDKYKDIINHDHHVSTRHPHMPELDRAAQFAPFAALTGYDAIINDVTVNYPQTEEICGLVTAQ